MRILKPLAVILCLAQMAMTAHAEKPWLKQRDYDRVQVLVAPTASDSEKKAADVFCDYWKKTTGEDAGRATEPSKRAVNVWIGRDGVPADLLARVDDIEGLGTDGVVIRTISKKEAGKLGGRHLLIIGGRERGTLYGVYEFYKQALGVRWLKPGVTHIPDAPQSIEAIAYRHVPKFIYRDSTYYWNWPNREEYQDANHISTAPGFGLFVHTSYYLLPPTKYFADHPDYYALVNGKRTAPGDYNWEDPAERDKHPYTVAQLCWSNPEMIAAITKELEKRIRENPGPKIWSVSQMDWGGNCECPKCRAIDEREGTPMGSLLTGINQIADNIRDEFPGYYVETLAYQYSRKPPKTIRPRDNVIIRLCSIECNFAKPLDDPSSPVNKAFADDIRAWASIAKNLHIWDYTPSYSSYSAPHPNFQVLQPNAEFFANNHVIGLFEQGAEYPGAEFCWLRGYLLAALMWDPTADEPALQNEFIDLYYGKAAPYIKEYIALITNKVVNDNIFMNCFDEALWMDYDMVEKAEAIFKDAFAAADTEEIRKRVDEAYLPVQWSALVCSPKVEANGNTLTLRRPPSITLDEYFARAKSFGMEHKDTFDYTNRRCHNTTPPRLQTTEMVPLENDRYLIWTVPEQSGAIIRWRDKKNDLELIQAYSRYWDSAGKWEDWVSTPFQAEGPVADHYTVVSKTSNALTIRGISSEGLVVDRTVQFTPDGQKLAVTLKVSNPTDKTLDTVAKIHPEFYAQGPFVPQIWLGDGKQWKQANTKVSEHQLSYGEYLEAKPYHQMAFYVPQKKAGVACTFDPAQVHGLLWFFNSEPTSEQANLELILDRRPLKPGQSRQLEGTYYPIVEPPAAQ